MVASGDLVQGVSHCFRCQI